MGFGIRSSPESGVKSATLGTGDNWDLSLNPPGMVLTPWCYQALVNLAPGPVSASMRDAQVEV